jgi:hypothetical protein
MLQEKIAYVLTLVNDYEPIGGIAAEARNLERLHQAQRMIEEIVPEMDLMLTQLETEQANLAVVDYWRDQCSLLKLAQDNVIERIALSKQNLRAIS